MNTTERFTRPVSALPTGTILTRTLASLALGKGSTHIAADMAHEKYGNTTPEVAWLLRSAVEAGDTTTSGWGLQLVGTTAGRELLTFLDSASVFFALTPNMIEMPFRTPMPVETTSFTAAWISEAGPVPVSKLTLASSNTTLEFYKLGIMTFFTEELARLSSPGAESRFRARFIASIARAVDGQFLGPTISEISGQRPASITNGATSVTSTGSTEAAIRANLTSMLAALTSWDSPRWVLPRSTAAFMSTLTTSGGSIAFPGLSATGGELFGIRVLTTTNISGFITLLDAASILFARDVVAVDSSREAMIEADTEPAVGELSPPSTQSVLIPLFQRNMVALKAIQGISYQRGHDGAVVFMNVSY